MSYEINVRIKALGNKIKLIADGKNSYRSYFDPAIRQENLLHNLAILLSKLLLCCKLPSHPTTTQLDNFIQAYNSNNSTDISIETYFDKAWVFIILGHLQFPSLLLSQFGKFEQKPGEVLPEQLDHDIKCLYEFYLRYHKDAITISSIEAHKHFTNLELSKLTEREILISIDPTIFSVNKSGDTFRYLRNEIVSGIWILLREDNRFPANNLKFRKFIEILDQVDELLPDNLHAFLSNADLSVILDECHQLLLQENDLADNGDEFLKAWMDQVRHGHNNLFMTIPKLKLNTDTSLTSVKTTSPFHNYYQGVFDYSETRSVYNRILFLILSNDDIGNEDYNYSRTREILKDTKRPYLIRQTFWYIRSNFPFVLAHLLRNVTLAPMCLYGLEKLELSTDSVPKIDHFAQYRYLQENLTGVWKESYDIFLLQLISREPVEESQAALSEILFASAMSFFTGRGADYKDNIAHLEARKRFEYAIISFSELRNLNQYNNGVSARVFPEYIESVFLYIKKYKATQANEYLSFPSASIELCTQLLKLCNTSFYKNEITSDSKSNLYKLRTSIIDFISSTMSYYFIGKFIEILELHSGILKKERIRRGIVQFGYEIIEWGYLLFHLFITGHLQKMHAKFISSIRFKKNSPKGKYDDLNREQFDKLKLYIKAIGLAIIHSEKELIQYELLDNKAIDYKTFLFTQLRTLSISYSVDDLTENRINVFEDRYALFESNLYNESLQSVVFSAINKDDEKNQVEFIRLFLASNSDLKLLLTASNYFSSKQVEIIISEKINNIAIQEYIKKSGTISEIESAVIQAINSKEYKLVKPLIERIKSHAEKVPFAKKDYDSFIFEISLHLALKEKNLAQIESIELPEVINGNFNSEAEDRRIFFLGLYQLFILRDEEKAIESFARIIVRNPHNFEIKYHLFHAEVMQAYKAGQYGVMPGLLKSWDEFIKQQPDEEKNKYPHLESSIIATTVIIYVSLKDYDSLFRAISRLPEQLLYEEDLIMPIHKAYQEKELYELAAEYLLKAEDYYQSILKPAPEELRNLCATANDEQLLRRLTISYRHIITLPVHKLIRTIPERLNDKKNLPDFLTQEIIKAGKLMIEKIKAVESIRDENKYNDIVLALLRFRFPIWGLSISDQPRAGSSQKGKDAGELDFLICQEDESIALIEAMTMDGKSFSKTRDHILKCKKYLSTTKFAYMVTYFISTDDFVFRWKDYKKDLCKISYPDNFKLQKKEVEDYEIFSKYMNIKIASTTHKDGFKLYHLFFNLQKQ